MEGQAISFAVVPKNTTRTSLLERMNELRQIIGKGWLTELELLRAKKIVDEMIEIGGQV